VDAFDGLDTPVDILPIERVDGWTPASHTEVAPWLKV
jgi:hypothetical protein